MGVQLIGVYLTGVYLTGVHLIGVYLMGVYLIVVYFRFSKMALWFWRFSMWPLRAYYPPYIRTLGHSARWPPTSLYGFCSSCNTTGILTPAHLLPHVSPHRFCSARLRPGSTSAPVLLHLLSLLISINSQTPPSIGFQM